MSGHTPGPWRVDPRYQKDVQTGGGALEIACTCEEVLNGGTKPAHTEQLANARLIAAAPELLEALIAMRIVMDMGLRPQKLDEALSWRACDEKARAMCDAAIAKATGEPE